MLDDSIIKIFHDCRHDGLALHEFMNTCMRNVFDTSGMDILITQLDLYQKRKNGDETFNNKLSSVKNPGLNDLFSKY